MSLKRIEIHGFKSFSEHTVIDIDENQNFVGIVGPNGCGKSNISDAIRWVLGESSAKQIRGSNMRDVIFSGSEKVKPMNFAEVVLYFDNPSRENGQKVFNYSGDEFSIGRKIFRNKGDNVYYFNGKPCRRSEIMALFRDTGAGKDGFSIVGQGRISDIIISKSQDRRKIFDEAAGVSNNKATKRDTIKKLDGIAINLANLQMTHDYYEADLKVLAEEVEKAHRYVEVTNQIKDLELNYFIHIQESLDKDKAKIQGDIDAKTEYLEKQEQGLSEVKRKLSKLDEETKTIDEEIDRSYNLRQELSVRSVKRNSEYLQYESTLKNAKDTLKRITAESESVNKDIEKYTAEQEECAKELDKAKSALGDKTLEKTKIKAEYDMLDSDIKTIQSEIDTYSDKRLSGVEDISFLKSLEASASATVDVLKETIESNKKSIAEATQSIAQDKAKLEDLSKRIDDIRTKKESVNNDRKTSVPKINELKIEKNRTAQQYNAMIAQLAYKKNDVETLTTRLKEEHGYNKVTRAVLERAKTDQTFSRYVLGAVGDLYKVDSKYYEAISACLGGSINNIVTENREGSKIILEYAKSLHMGRLTTYPLRDMQGERLARSYQSALNHRGVIGLACDLIEYERKYDDVYTQLLGKIVVVDNFDTASEMRSLYPRMFKMVTLNGEYFDISGAISGGDNKSYTEQALIKAKKEYEAYKAKFDDLEKHYHSFDQKIAEINDKYENARTLFEKYTTEESVCITEKNSYAQRLELSEKVLRETQVQLSVLEKRLEDKFNEIDEAKTKSGEASSDRSYIDTLIENKKKALAEKQVLFNEFAEKLKACEVAISALSEQEKQLEANLERIILTINDRKNVADSYVTDIQNQVNHVIDLEKNAPAPVLTEEDTEQIEKINQDITAYNARKEEIIKLRASLNLDSDNFNERIVQASKDLASSHTRLENMDNEVVKWTETIYNNYGLTYETALPYKRENYEHSKTNTELSKLNAIKNRMGNVNLNAEETFKVKNAEFEVLSANLLDAQKAKADTESLLETISQEIDKKFSVAFTAIGDYFQQTFTDLFGGGKAELVLVPQEEDDEDDGVDIAVQLPGKSKKSLSLLSGGEQTLTAIAIIFAILRYRSSPFVILDEVESALDESNCVRFAKYLREFSKIARFLVITHKKPTMENADILYGVTMMRPGISNIVSVSMSEAQKMSEDNE